MTTQQLADLEAKAEAEHRAEQAERMAQAMKAVAFVSNLKLPNGSTYHVRQMNRK